MISPKSKSTSALSPSSSSTSSFDMLSSLSHTDTTTGQDVVSVASDDEIVWSVSEDSWSESSDHSPSTKSSLAASDDDFVVLSWAAKRSAMSSTSIHPPTIANDLSANFQRLSLGEQSVNLLPTRHEKAGRRRKGKNSKPQVQPSPVTIKTPHPSPIATPRPERQTPLAISMAQPMKSKRGKKKNHATPGLGARPIVDDMSEWTSEAGDEAPSSIYEDAGKYITTFLTNPTSRDRVSRLTLLQALIIELGLCSSPSSSTLPALPSSLRAAKALIKSNAFLNIREYIAVRHQGPTALQRVMYPSRSSLVKDIRKNKSATSLKWVKEHGLQVLLVSPYH